MVKVLKSHFWKMTHAPDKEPYEEFDKKKIEMALVRAGARKPNVIEIASLVQPYDGITTEEIDNIVYSELKKRDPETAKYWKIKRDYNRSRF